MTCYTIVNDNEVIFFTLIFPFQQKTHLGISTCTHCILVRLGDKVLGRIATQFLQFIARQCWLNTITKIVHMTFCSFTAVGSVGISCRWTVVHTRKQHKTRFSAVSRTDFTAVVCQTMPTSMRFIHSTQKRQHSKVSVTAIIKRNDFAVHKSNNETEVKING